MIGTATALFLNREFFGVERAALDRAPALGAARRDQRGALDLGVSPELGRDQLAAAASSV